MRLIPALGVLSSIPTAERREATLTGDDDKDRDDARFERTVERLLQTPPKPKRVSESEKGKEPEPESARPSKAQPKRKGRL